MVGLGPRNGTPALSVFGICKTLGAARVWLTRGAPFVTWGPEPHARWYPTEGMARRIIASLPIRDREAAAIAPLDHEPVFHSAPLMGWSESGVCVGRSALR